MYIASTTLMLVAHFRLPSSELFFSVQMKPYFCRCCIIIMSDSKHQISNASGEHSGHQSTQPALQENPDPTVSS